ADILGLLRGQADVVKSQSQIEVGGVKRRIAWELLDQGAERPGRLGGLLVVELAGAEVVPGGGQPRILGLAFDELLAARGGLGVKLFALESGGNSVLPGGRRVELFLLSPEGSIQEQSEDCQGQPRP